MNLFRMRFGAIVPEYATKGSACFDLHACLDAPLVIPPGKMAAIPTGWAFSPPTNYYVELYSRSGQACKHGVRLANSVGIIDNDYRGEVMVLLHNDGCDLYTVEHGDRIAQGMLKPMPYRPAFKEVSRIYGTDRGSTGK